MAFGESELTQFGKEDLVTWRGDRIVIGVWAQHANTCDPVRRLRVRRERPHGRSAAKQRNELPPLHALPQSEDAPYHTVARNAALCRTAKLAANVRSGSDSVLRPSPPHVRLGPGNRTYASDTAV